VQTPQAFAFDLILDAHRKAAQAARDLTDDAMVAEAAGHAVHVFAGDPANIKLTTTEDFLRAQALLLKDLPDIRTGQGYDVHAFGPGDHVWLGGVAIPHSHGLEGHSDADVLAHAITDAALGAAALGDIGRHFPDTDPRYRDADSRELLRAAARMVQQAGWVVVNVDTTIIAQAPKMAPYIALMAKNIAADLGIAPGHVNVKAKTTEGLGFAGRGEGIAAQAVVLLNFAPAETAMPEVP